MTMYESQQLEKALRLRLYHERRFTPPPTQLALEYLAEKFGLTVTDLRNRIEELAAGGAKK